MLIPSCSFEHARSIQDGEGGIRWERVVQTISKKFFWLDVVYVLCTWFIQYSVLLQSLWQSGHLNTKAVIVVGNKIDLVRNREVPIDGESSVQWW